jgi:hypothetical protein
MSLKPAKLVAPFTQTNFQYEFQKFNIKQPDRLTRLYIIGKWGTGNQLSSKQ